MRPKSYSSSPRPSSPSITTAKRSPNLQSQPGSSTANPSPLKMVTTTSTHGHHADGAPYYLSSETKSHSYGWAAPIVIEDDDLMFGGKSLSTWHEEGRQKVSYPAEEERRGRQRVRQYHSYSHHQTYAHQQSKSKASSSTDQKKH